MDGLPKLVRNERVKKVMCIFCLKGVNEDHNHTYIQILYTAFAMMLPKLPPPQKAPSPRLSPPARRSKPGALVPSR